MNEQLDALKHSAARLARIVEPLDRDQLRAQAYPKDWNVAQVLSHIGSGGVIHERRLAAFVADRPLPDGFQQPIWDEWNAKSPEAAAADTLKADRALLHRIDSLTDEQRAGFRLELGPLQVDFTGFLGLRVNEHAIHTWDVEVIFEPTAVLSDDATRLIVDRLELITRYTGKPTGIVHDVRVRTSSPDRDFVIAFASDGVTLAPNAGPAAPELELPAEAFVRLVYGRLDPDHAPASSGTADLDELRRAFPGP